MEVTARCSALGSALGAANPQPLLPRLTERGDYRVAGTAGTRSAPAERASFAPASRADERSRPEWTTDALLPRPEETPTASQPPLRLQILAREVAPAASHKTLVDAIAQAESGSAARALTLASRHTSTPVRIRPPDFDPAQLEAARAASRTWSSHGPTARSWRPVTVNSPTTQPSTP